MMTLKEKAEKVADLALDVFEQYWDKKDTYPDNISKWVLEENPIEFALAFMLAHDYISESSLSEKSADIIHDLYTELHAGMELI
jgi:hypothetical protein